MRPVWLYLIFPHYPINRTIFGKKKLPNKKCAFFYFLYIFCLEHFSFQEELNEILLHTYTHLYLRNLSFLSEFNGTDLKKNSLPNFMNILPSGSQDVPRGQTDSQADMTKPVVTFHSFAKHLKMYMWDCADCALWQLHQMVSSSKKCAIRTDLNYQHNQTSHPNTALHAVTYYV